MEQEAELAVREDLVFSNRLDELVDVIKDLPADWEFLDENGQIERWFEEWKHGENEVDL